MTTAKAKFIIDVCVAISFVAVAAGRYVASLADLPDERKTDQQSGRCGAVKVSAQKILKNSFGDPCKFNQSVRLQGEGQKDPRP